MTGSRFLGLLLIVVPVSLYIFLFVREFGWQELFVMHGVLLLFAAGLLAVVFGIALLIGG